MTRRDDVPVHGSEVVEEIESTETLAAPSELTEDAEAHATALVADTADEQPFFVISTGEDPLESAAPDVSGAADEPASPAENLEADAVAAEIPDSTQPVAEESEDAPDSHLPDDLRELSEMLDRPTAEIMPITDEVAAAAAADAAESGDTEIAQSASAEDAAEGEGVEGEGEGGSEGESTATFDDIGPGTVAGAAAAEGATAAEGSVLADAAAEPDDAEAALGRVSWWPFAGYMLVWLLAAAYSVWSLRELPADQVVYESTAYSYSMLGALVLLAAGPVLLLIVWLASWIGRAGAKIGSMLVSALWKGSFATLFGAAVWAVSLLLIDHFRLGRPY